MRKQCANNAGKTRRVWRLACLYPPTPLCPFSLLQLSLSYHPQIHLEDNLVFVLFCVRSVLQNCFFDFVCL